MSSPLHTPERVAIIDKVAEIGPAMAARAEELDRSASFPYANWDDLKAAGLLAICIPKEAGGLGGDFVAYALASEELSRHCASTALTFNMHVATTLLVGEIGGQLDMDAEAQEFLDARRRLIWKGIVEEQHIHSQPFSEGAQASATAGYATRATPVAGGYRVSGKKIFASLAGAADFHNVLAMVEGDDRVRMLGVPHRGEGVEIIGEWDPLGMRGTDSRDMVMTEVFVPAEQEWLPPGHFNQSADRFPYFFMTLSFSYVGLMRAILDFTADYLTKSGRRDLPMKQQGWAEMNLIYEQAQALLYRVLGEVQLDPSPAQVRRAMSSLVTTMEGAPQMASLAVRVCGGRSMLRPSFIERAYRDARCGATMLPWSVEVCLERLSRSGLYEDGET